MFSRPSYVLSCPSSGPPPIHSTSSISLATLSISSPALNDANPCQLAEDSVNSVKEERRYRTGACLDIVIAILILWGLLGLFSFRATV